MNSTLGASPTTRVTAAPATRSAVSPSEAVGGDLGFKMLGGIAATCFIGGLVTDIVYARDPDMVWVTFSVWAITIGLIVAAVATLFGLVARLVHHRLGTIGALWPYLVGFAIVVIVEIFNAFVHSRDAYEAVVPDGITLSAVAVALLVLTPIVGSAFSRSRTRKATL